MTPDQTEVLVASPVHSEVLRFDAETLDLKGSIPSIFGVRSLAIDPVRKLLLCGSMVNNLLEVIDLETNKRIAKYYVGPWFRKIVLDTNTGIAYISTGMGLYRVNYMASIRGDQPHSLNSNMGTIATPGLRVLSQNRRLRPVR
jgi:DNA-binding beta-propeller fold protein YncE